MSGRVPPPPPSPTSAASSDSLTKPLINPLGMARQEFTSAVSVEDDPQEFHNDSGPVSCLYPPQS